MKFCSAGRAAGPCPVRGSLARPATGRLSAVDTQLYQRHLEELQQRWQAALEFAGMDAALVAAGTPREFFLDDQGPPFRPNPHFAQWYPDADCAGAILLLQPGRQPRLYFHQPRDYWHQPPSVPEWARQHLDVQVFDEPEALLRAVAAAAGGCNRLALVAEQPPAQVLAGAPGADALAHNPPLLLNHLHFGRACKTDFEIACLAAANRRAAAGHRAAAEAFGEGCGEFDIHMRFLAAARQTPAELPYHSIIAQNTHAGVLHYQHYDRQPPQPLRSLLIDAGASDHGYAADVTRTYAAPSEEAFGDLIDAMDRLQRGLIERIRPGMPYPELHTATHEALAQVLSDHALVTCSAASALEQGITQAFLPHGVGHLIGLQTHDVGGLQSAPEGGERPPPDAYPALRLTRTIEAAQVFTIEPGMYFIPMLLEELRDSPAAADVDWRRVERLAPCGGIRIEDNVLVTADGVRNLTREAFAAQS